MTSVMVLDGVRSFLHLKDVTNTCKCMGHSPTIECMDFLSAMAESWKKLKTSNVFSSFKLLCVRIKIDQLLCNHSLFVRR